MGTSGEQRNIRDGAVEHLETALAATSSTEKEFHIRQALQLLDFETTAE